MRHCVPHATTADGHEMFSWLLSKLSESYRPLYTRMNGEWPRVQISLANFIGLFEYVRGI